MKKLFLPIMLIAIMCFAFIAPHNSNLNVANAAKTSTVFGLDLSGAYWDDQKMFDKSTLENDFFDDKISVVLTRRTSLQLKTYSNQDFPELKLSDVEHVSTVSEQNVKIQLENAQKLNTTPALRDSSANINIENFRQSLVLTLREPGKENVLNAIKLLEKRNDVYAASPDFFIEYPEPIISNCSDENFCAGEHICDGEQTIIVNATNYTTNNWALNKINMPEAWSVTTGSTNISVGIIDCGIDKTHPNLSGIIHPTSSIHKDFTGGNNPFPTSSDYHGTMVAGVVAAQNNYDIGVAKNIRLVSLRVTGLDSVTGWNQVANAINHANTNNIPIINMSLGSDSFGNHAGTRQALTDFNGLGHGDATLDNLLWSGHSK